MNEKDVQAVAKQIYDNKSGIKSSNTSSGTKEFNSALIAEVVV